MDEKNYIYLDNNATTLLDPVVKKEMDKVFSLGPLNASSIHSQGRKASQMLKQARKDIAASLQVEEKEILFTSGATEAINLVLHSFLQKFPKGEILTSPIEHPAVLETLKQQEAKVHYVAIDEKGDVTEERIKAALTPSIKLAIFSAVNTETGVKNDLKMLARLAYQNGLFLILDGVGILGKAPFSIEEGISAMVFSPHKVHGPQGTGILYAKKDFPLTAQIKGGGQERNLRSGTENLAGIIGAAKAFCIAIEKSTAFEKKMEELRNLFETTLLTQLENVSVNGKGCRICNTSNLCFEGIDGETLLILLDQNGILASHGSACASHALEPSKVLLEMKIPLERVQSSLRFSLSRFTTKEEIIKACEIITSLVTKLKTASFTYSAS